MRSGDFNMAVGYAQLVSNFRKCSKTAKKRGTKKAELTMVLQLVISNSDNKWYIGAIKQQQSEVQKKLAAL